MARYSTKGTRSKTRPGRKNYTTKKGNKVFHHKGHNVKRKRKPYTKGAFIGGYITDPRYRERYGPKGAAAGGRIRYGPAALPAGLRGGGFTANDLSKLGRALG